MDPDRQHLDSSPTKQHTPVVQLSIPVRRKNQSIRLQAMGSLGEDYLAGRICRVYEVEICIAIIPVAPHPHQRRCYASFQVR